MGHEKAERGKHSEERTGRGIGKSEEGEEKRVEKLEKRTNVKLKEE